MCLDALEREESCGGHFRVESQTPDGEALRDDERFLVRVGMGMEGRRRPVGAASRSPSPSSTFTLPRGATSSP